MTLKIFKSAVPILVLVLMAVSAGCHHEQSAPHASTLESAENTPVASLDGFVWQSSAPQSKLDFLLGVECAMAMEAAIKQVAEDRGGTVQLSRFANGWQIAFRDKARPDIVRQIDEFYTQNPEQKKRHVFDVIWTEMVRPAVEAGEKAEK
ncbi:MAG: hypothetical protein IKY97_03900 [Mailhella sp.]|nr:hypothetical protein [Mailhella sp.]